MKCKMFNLRLNERYANSDEARLNEFLAGASVKRVFAHCSSEGGGCLWSMVFLYESSPADSKPAPTVQKQSLKQVTVLTPDEEMIYEELHRWRNETASQEGLAAFMVAHNEALRQMVRLRARTPEELAKIKGFGQNRIRKYGNDILRILNA